MYTVSLPWHLVTEDDRQKDWCLNHVSPSICAADVMLVQPRVEFILSFIQHIAEDEDRSDGVVANAVGLIG